jgi:lipopolysaccharide transport protein LptA
MKSFFPILASALLLAAEAPAEGFNLLELIGSGSRNSARSRQSSSTKRRQVAKADVRTNAMDSVSLAATNETSSAESTPRILAIVVPETVTNTVPETVTNTAPEAVAAAAPEAITNTAPEAVANVAPEAIAEEKAEEATTNKAVRAAPPKRKPSPAHITSTKAYYDRKEGYAVLTGNVHVDSEEYQMHAQKAYVFFEGTNELKRIVATGDVAITNDTKRAYGAKASYYRSNGMVILYGDDKTAAEVRDESKGENQVVKGSKIKFWTMSEQVEVLDARISSPVTGGMDALKNGLKAK